jgi:hypothetical protein
VLRLAIEGNVAVRRSQGRGGVPRKHWAHTACTWRTNGKKHGWQIRNSRALKRADRECRIRIRSGQSRCRFGLEHNCSKYSSCQSPEPIAQARYAAIVQLAVFEAVNSITGEYQPYLGTITAKPDASPEAAAIEAAYEVLNFYFPNSASALLTAYTASLAQVPDGQAESDGIAAGDAAAAAMIALRSNDGSSPPQFAVPGPPAPGVWQATPSCPMLNGVAVGIAFQWQYVTPFGIPSASDFLLGPPPALTSNQYTKTYNEVMTVGSTNSPERPPDRANVALFYAASSPTQVFNQAAGQVAQEQRGSLSENARALALINMR